MCICVCVNGNSFYTKQIDKKRKWNFFSCIKLDEVRIIDEMQLTFFWRIFKLNFSHMWPNIKLIRMTKQYLHIWGSSIEVLCISVCVCVSSYQTDIFKFDVHIIKNSKNVVHSSSKQDAKNIEKNMRWTIKKYGTFSLLS